MDLINCKCTACDAALGTLINLWIQIGKRCIAPAAYDEDDPALNVSSTGPVRLEESDTLVAGWCADLPACPTSVVCILLNEGNQPATRCRMCRVPCKTGPKMRQNPREPCAQRVSLPEEVDAATICELQTHVAAQGESIAHIGKVGVQKISSLGTVISRVEQQVQQLNESVTELAIVKDENSRENDVSCFEQKLRKTDKSLSELRQAGSEWESTTKRLQEEVSKLQDENARLKQEVAETRTVARDGITTSKEYASEVAALRRELGKVRAELSEGIERRETASSPTFPPHELDIFATSMSKIWNRASQVESLQMEFELFKT
ncbi:hypothetical protein S40293_10381 [Stachybotrys chartarum IBT 40293]|nr:hypothetical protein S40293_10381 [Stachybotrys chartarum IBT 40293]